MSKEKKYKKLIYLYENLSQKVFPDASFYLIVSKAYLKTNNIKKLEEILTIAVNMEPCKFKPRYTLLMFYFKFNQIEKAKHLISSTKIIPIKIQNEESNFYRHKIISFRI